MSRPRSSSARRSSCAAVSSAQERSRLDGCVDGFDSFLGHRVVQQCVALRLERSQADFLKLVPIEQLKGNCLQKRLQRIDLSLKNRHVVVDFVRIHSARPF
jgi:hypothetical protein